MLHCSCTHHQLSLKSEYPLMSLFTYKYGYFITSLGFAFHFNSKQKRQIIIKTCIGTTQYTLTACVVYRLLEFELITRIIKAKQSKGVTVVTIAL